MKVRTDYVSNSSSCSFVIESEHVCKACKTAYDNLKGLAVPYDIARDIIIRVYAKNKNIDMLFKEMHDDGYCGISDKPNHYDGEDPEDISWESIELEVEQFVEFAKQLTADNSLSSLVEQIMFESDDYGSGPMNLRDFYDFFHRTGCKPTAKDSEHDFMCEDGTDFRSILKGTKTI